MQEVASVLETPWDHVDEYDLASRRSRRAAPGAWPRRPGFESTGPKKPAREIEGEKQRGTPRALI
jgi:hypothetical protein